jgi:hypothetical protein
LSNCRELLGLYLQGSIRQIPEEDFRLIESEMKKVVAERVKREEAQPRSPKGAEESEADVEAGIMALPLEAKTLHDRLGEMLEEIGSWLDYNTQTRRKIIPDHAYELDVTWLSGKNPEVAIEIQISGNLTEAKDRLAHARKFNYTSRSICSGSEFETLRITAAAVLPLGSWQIGHAGSVRKA